MAQVKKVKKVKKISEWLAEHGAWTIYDAKEAKTNFHEETGQFPKWPDYDYRTTYGHVKNSKAGGELDSTSDMRGKRFCYGYEMAYYLAKEYANHTSDKMGRGFMFWDCIEALKEAGF